MVTKEVVEAVMECLAQAQVVDVDLDLDLEIGKGPQLDLEHPIPVVVQMLGQEDPLAAGEVLGEDKHHMEVLLEEVAQEDNHQDQEVLHLKLEGHLQAVEVDLLVEEPLVPVVQQVLAEEEVILILRLGMVPQEVPREDRLVMGLRVSELPDLVVKDHFLIHSELTLVMVHLQDQVVKEILMVQLLVLAVLVTLILVKEDLEAQTLLTQGTGLLEAVSVMTALALVVTQEMLETSI